MLTYVMYVTQGQKEKPAAERRCYYCSGYHVNTHCKRVDIRGKLDKTKPVAVIPS